jgi:hypothetical protein
MGDGDGQQVLTSHCLEFGVAAEDERAAVGGRKVHVEHLHSGELLEHRPWGEARSERLEPRAQHDVQAVGQEDDVRRQPAVTHTATSARGPSQTRPGGHRVGPLLGVPLPQLRAAVKASGGAVVDPRPGHRVCIAASETTY